jgi:multicomponent Na+:H+ antiporter subunit D
MTWIPPLLVAVPLLAAALTASLDHVAPAPVRDALAIGAAAATTVLAVLLLRQAEGHEVVHWFGGWIPQHGVALGIDFAVGPLAAGMCVVIGIVVTLALLYSLTFLHEMSGLFGALMLVALGAMCGFAMSGDLFNLFVWLELMGVAAYALTGFQVERLGPVQGAVNFAITNSLGGYLLALGIALIYARTGALNLAQVGQALAHGSAGGLVIVAMTLLFCGFLVKGAVVPFHLWAADAYAVAPAPVCAVLGGVMTDIGLIGVARLYWTVFAVPFAGHAVGDVFLWLGIVTAVLAGAMAFLQRHLKRMLAYSVVCHIGIMLAGIGLLDSAGLAGVELMFLAHALLTAGLFFVAGILHSDHGLIDELHLRGRGRGCRAPAAAWFAGTIGLVGTPYVGIYLGHGLIDGGAVQLGRPWALPLLWLGAGGRSAAARRCPHLPRLGRPRRRAARKGDRGGSARAQRAPAAPRVGRGGRRRGRRGGQRRPRSRATGRVRGRPLSRHERVRRARPARPPDGAGAEPAQLDPRHLARVAPLRLGSDRPRDRARARGALPAPAPEDRLGDRRPDARAAGPRPPRAPQRRRRRLRHLARGRHGGDGRRLGPTSALSEARRGVATFARWSAGRSTRAEAGSWTRPFPRRPRSSGPRTARSTSAGTACAPTRSRAPLPAARSWRCS